MILGPAEPNNPAFVYISARTFLFMLTGLLYVTVLLLTSLCFCFVFVVPERLTDTSDVYALDISVYVYIFAVSISFCSIHMYVL